MRAGQKVLTLQLHNFPIDMIMNPTTNSKIQVKSSFGWPLIFDHNQTYHFVILNIGSVKIEINHYKYNSIRKVTRYFKTIVDYLFSQFFHSHSLAFALLSFSSSLFCFGFIIFSLFFSLSLQLSLSLQTLSAPLWQQFFSNFIILGVASFGQQRGRRGRGENQAKRAHA